MTATIQLRRGPLTADEQLGAWEALCNDKTLAGIAYKIETDAWGAMRMGPTQTRHARMVGRIMRLIQAKLGGEAMPELAIMTSDGIKVPDVCWCSDTFLAHDWLVAEDGAVEVHTQDGARDDSTFSFNPALELPAY